MSRLVTPTASGRFSREIMEDYNEINFLETDDVKIAKLEMWIAKNIGDVLVKTYSRREWGVRVDIPNQQVIVTCDSVSILKGYHISMVGRNIHDLAKEAKKAAGEILERHGVPRTHGINDDAIDSLPRDYRDEVITEDSDAD